VTSARHSIVHVEISWDPCRRFSRIQSTACEQQRFEALVAGLDPELLMALAAGRTCLLWDCASRAQVIRLAFKYQSSTRLMIYNHGIAQSRQPRAGAPWGLPRHLVSRATHSRRHFRCSCSESVLVDGLFRLAHISLLQRLRQCVMLCIRQAGCVG